MASFEAMNISLDRFSESFEMNHCLACSSKFEVGSSRQRMGRGDSRAMANLIFWRIPEE